MNQRPHWASSFASGGGIERIAATLSCRDQVPEGQGQLSSWTYHFHSSVLAWRISGTGDPGGLPSMGSHRVRHDWATSLTHSLSSEREEWKSWVNTQHSKNSDHGSLFHHFMANRLEKAMATHSSVLAWRISGTGQPGGLPSMGSRRVGHDWSGLTAAAAAAAAAWIDRDCLFES